MEETNKIIELLKQNSTLLGHHNNKEIGVSKTSLKIGNKILHVFIEEI